MRSFPKHFQVFKMKWTTDYQAAEAYAEVGQSVDFLFKSIH